MMIVWTILGIAVGALLYRLGLRDGLSVGRRGELPGSARRKEDSLLKRMEAYDGRKEHYDQ